jgi:hypothetical protein
VIGRIYNTKKMAQGRPRKDEKEVNLTSFSGSDATAKEVAEEVGVSEVTVRRAGKFAEVVAALERISPKAAALADFQRRPARWTVTFAFVVASPYNWRCSRSQTLTHCEPRRTL